MQRLVVFGDSNILASRMLLEAVCKAVKQSKDLEIVAFCDSTLMRPLGDFVRSLRLRSVSTIKWLFNSEYRASLEYMVTSSFRRLGNQFNVPVIRPPQQNINHPEFINHIRQELKADFALSCICLQLFSPELLQVFSVAVNYHNGLLPKYRGLKATGWSIYFKEESTGFTFHLMTEGIDDGRILLQDAIPVEANDSLYETEIKKTLKAGERIGEVLQMMLDGKTGISQTGDFSYFSSKDFRTITTIEDPSQHTAHELLHRLKSFEGLSIRIGDKIYQVTKLAKVEDSSTPKKGLEFLTHDGVKMKPTRFHFMPWWLYVLYSLIRFPS